ncbi:MAG TPA: hypothetical protein VL523_08670 [Terriglobia bacterium]|nr:hypothetical protein [Terriglobia bacterium]
MSITLNLSPEIVAGLRSQAQARGLPLDAYLQELLSHSAAAPRGGETLRLQQFDAELDALAEGSEGFPYLPPQAVTRESFYRDHN